MNNYLGNFPARVNQARAGEWAFAHFRGAGLSSGRKYPLHAKRRVAEQSVIDAKVGLTGMPT